MPDDHDLLRVWSLPPVATFTLALSAVVYTRGWWLLRRAGVPFVPPWRAVAFLCGLLTVWIALASPIDAVNDVLLSVTGGGLRALLAGSSLHEPGSARNLQDPLTFRSIPQILGAARDALGYTRTTIETELNSAGCNPAVVLAERRIVSVGNLDIVPVAAALDFARIALATVVTCAAERTVKLLQSPLSGLPPGLAAEPDTGEEALAEFGGAVQAIAAEARLLAHPVSFEVVSSGKAEGIEDRTTMAPLAARRLADMADLAARVISLELLVAAQAIDLRRPARLGEGTGRALRLVRELAGFTARGRAPPADLEPLVDAVRAGSFARAALPGQ